jgi:hypothetical protein
MEHCVGRQWPDDIKALVADMLDCRAKKVDFLAPHIAIFAGVRIETGDRQTRVRDTEIALQSLRRSAQPLSDEARFELTGDRRIGTTRKSGPASIMTAWLRDTPHRSAMNSVWPGWVKPTA